MDLFSWVVRGGECSRQKHCCVYTFLKHLIWQYNTSYKTVEEIAELFHSFFQRWNTMCSFSHWWETIHVLSVLLFWLTSHAVLQAWMSLEVEKAEIAELPYKQNHWVMLCKVCDVDLCYISWNKVAGSYWEGLVPIFLLPNWIWLFF